MARGRMYSAMQPWGGQGFEDPWTARRASESSNIRQMQLQNFLSAQNQARQDSLRERLQRMALDFEREKLARSQGLSERELGLRERGLQADIDWRAGSPERESAAAQGRRAHELAMLRENASLRPKSMQEQMLAELSPEQRSKYAQTMFMSPAQRRMQDMRAMLEAAKSIGIPVMGMSGQSAPSTAQDAPRGQLLGASGVPEVAPTPAAAMGAAAPAPATGNVRDMIKAYVKRQLTQNPDQQQYVLNPFTGQMVRRGDGDRFSRDMKLMDMLQNMEQQGADRLRSEAEALESMGDRQGAAQLRARALEMGGSDPALVKRVKSGLVKPKTAWLRENIDPMVDQVQKALTAEGSTFTELLTGPLGVLKPTGSVRQEEQSEYESVVGDIMTQAVEQGVDLTAVRDYLEKRLKVGAGSKSKTAQFMQNRAREIINRLYQQARKAQLSIRS